VNEEYSEGGVCLALWKFLTVFLVFAALLFETKPVYTLAYTFMVLFFFSRRLQQSCADQLKVVRNASTTHLFPDDQATIEIRLENPSWLPFAWVSGVDGKPTALDGGKRDKWVTALPPRGMATASYQITAANRGVYVLGPLDISVGDFFGITTQSYRVEDYQTVVVYPTVCTLTDLALPSRLPFGHARAQQKIYPDPSRLGGVRPYEPGDPLRSIHWKATARERNLQVKQFEHTVTITTMILLNLDERDYDVHSFYVDTELAITTAASLAAHIIGLGEECGLASNGVFTRHAVDELDDSYRHDGVLRISPRKGYSHLMSIFTALAGVECQSSHGFSELIDDLGRHYSFGSLFLLVVPVDTGAIVDKALNLTKLGYQVQIFVVGTKVIHRHLLQQPAHASLQMFQVKQDTKLNFVQPR
jgi:hypothetical protein